MEYIDMEKNMVRIDGYNYEWDMIVGYMDDETREQVHFELAPCTNEEFINRYFELDPQFKEFILHSF